MDLKELGGGGQRHPWELARAGFFATQIRAWSVGQKPMRVLDIGSGDTWLARQMLNALPEGSSMTCVDKSFSSEQKQSFSNSALRIEALSEIPKGVRYDLITLLDVVEHVKEDHKFVVDLLSDHLVPGGRLLISVPAYQCLFSSHDTWLEHFRRYSPGQGRKLVKGCGLSIVEEGGLFHGLLYARILSKLIEKIFPPRKVVGVGAWNRGSALTQVILGVLNLDWRVTELLRKVGVRIPGLSWWCLCHKA